MGADSILLAFSVNWHQVKEVCPQCFNVVQTGLNLAESSAVAIQFGVHLINLPVIARCGGQGKDFRGIVGDNGSSV